MPRVTEPAFPGCLLATLAVLGAALSPADVLASACPVESPCRVEGLDTLVVAPPGWDGSTPLPLVIWFHGHAETAEAVVSDRFLTDAFARARVLLAVPNGPGRSWAVPGAPIRARDDLALGASLVGAIRARLALPPSRTYAFGFSIGGSMVWNLACRSPASYAAFVAFSGTFWTPLPDRCADGRLDLLHVHGTADSTFPIAGRVVRGAFRQGDTDAALSLLVREKRCAVPVAGPLPSTCRAIPCANGGEIASCRHDGGHLVEPAWIETAVRWAEARQGEPERVPGR